MLLSNGNTRKVYKGSILKRFMKELSHFEKMLLNLIDFYHSEKIDSNLFVRNYKAVCMSYFNFNHKKNGLNRALFDFWTDLEVYQPNVKIREQNAFTFGEKGLKDKTQELAKIAQKMGYDLVN